jgi:hypothetical protein
MEGKTKWSTYLGGSNDEPYKLESKSYVWGRVQFIDWLKYYLEGDTFVIASSTYSTDFPEINSMNFNNNPALLMPDAQTKAQPPSYVVITVLNSNGKINWSTYLTTDASNEQLNIKKNKTKESVYDYFVGEQILDIAIHKNKVYCIATTNDKHTLLYLPNGEPKDHSGYTFTKRPYYNYLLTILQLE